jgi:hypothetical protein
MPASAQPRLDFAASSSQQDLGVQVPQDSASRIALSAEAAD